MSSSKNSTKKQAPKVVRQIVFHFGPHLDEYVGAIMARLFGREVWTSIATARIATEKCAIMDFAPDQLPIGIGEGDFDEHGPDKDPRLCSADLVAQHLGIQHLDKVSLLLKNVRSGDRNGKSTPLNLGQCIHVLTRFGWSPTKIEKWLMVFFQCYFDDRTIIKGKNHVVKSDSIEFPVSNPQCRGLIGLDTDNLFKRWLKFNSRGKDQAEITKLTAKLRKDLTSITKHEPSKMFDLIECVSLIAAFNPDNEKVVYQWVKPIFDACMAFQKKFLEAYEICKKSKTHVIKPSQCTDNLRVLGIDRRSNGNDNPCLVPAAKYLNSNLDFLVMQQSTGNTQIMVLRSHRSHLLPMIARALRLEEMIANDMNPNDIQIDYDHLASPGRINCSPLWYLPIDDKGHGFALFNGSLTITDIDPTLIFFDEIIRIVNQMVLLNDTETDWLDYSRCRIKRYRDTLSQKKSGNSFTLGDLVGKD